MAYGTHAPSAPDELAGQPGPHRPARKRPDPRFLRALLRRGRSTCRAGWSSSIRCTRFSKAAAFAGTTPRPTRATRSNMVRPMRAKPRRPGEARSSITCSNTATRRCRSTSPMALPINSDSAGELAEKGHKHVVAYVHRFGEAGTMGQMDCVYSYWVTRRDEGFGAQGLAALRDLVPVLGLAIKIRGAGRYRQDAGPGLSRARRCRAGVARKNHARRHRAHQHGAVVLRPARLDRDQREHRARRDHSVPQ